MNIVGLFTNPIVISEELKIKKSANHPADLQNYSVQKLKLYARQASQSNLYSLSNDEFENDFRLFLSIKRYLTRFINTKNNQKSINIRVLINQLVILSNCFGVKVVSDVLDKLIVQKDARIIVKTCVVFLSYGDSLYMGKETPVDIELLKQLGNL